MSCDYSFSQGCKEELRNIYSDYFLEDEESFLHTVDEFLKFYDKLPPERLIIIKYRQFISRLLYKNKEMLEDTADYKAILTNIPLYKHLHAILVDYDADLKEIMSFEDLFKTFNKFHKLYDVLDEVYNRDPQTSLRIKFVDFMNKVLKFYSDQASRCYTEESLPKFEKYLKSKLLVTV